MIIINHLFNSIVKDCFAIFRSGEYAWRR